MPSTQLYGLAPEAYEELDEIRTYVADDNPDSADRLVTEIFDRYRALVQFPHQLK